MSGLNRRFDHSATLSNLLRSANSNASIRDLHFNHNKATDDPAKGLMDLFGSSEKIRAYAEARLRTVQAQSELRELELMKLMVGRVKPLVAFDHPDQSPLKISSLEGSLIQDIWEDGMDRPGGFFAPEGLPYLSNWYMNIYLGNYDAFMQTISTMSSDIIAKYLMKRETVLLHSAIFLPILGAMGAYVTDENNRKIYYNGRKHDCRHMDILNKLIELGAQLDVPDLGGFTPLHFCARAPQHPDEGAAGNDVTYAMAEKLLQAGADPNVINRYGATPLQHLLLGPKGHDTDVDTVRLIKLLVKYGADPYYKDQINPGLTISPSLPRITQELLKEAKVAKKGEECAVCKGNGDMRCTGCYLEWYCSRDCQMTHWKTHMKFCKKIKSQYKEVMLVNSNNNICEHLPAKTSNFIVKVIVNPGDKNSDMIMYNKQRDFHYLISLLTDVGKNLINNIPKENPLGIPKGYFLACIKKGKFYINPTMLPEQNW